MQSKVQGPESKVNKDWINDFGLGILDFGPLLSSRNVLAGKAAGLWRRIS